MRMSALVVVCEVLPRMMPMVAALSPDLWRRWRRVWVWPSSLVWCPFAVAWCPEPV